MLEGGPARLDQARRDGFGEVLVMFCECFGDVPGMFQKCFGDVLGEFREKVKKPTIQKKWPAQQPEAGLVSLAAGSG